MKTRILVSTVWGILLFLTVAFLVGRYHDRRNDYLSDQIDRFQLRLQASADDLEVFSRYTLDSFTGDGVVPALVGAAWAGDDREVIRARLYDYMLPYYERVNGFRSSQIQFHFPDTMSFLRMNRPDRFGDYLGDIRESVRVANREQRSTRGFEAGRVQSGYRFVYPLAHEGEHVGTVEVSFSMDAFLQVLKSVEGGEYISALRDQVVLSAVFPELLDTYEESVFSSRLVINRSVPAAADLQRLLVDYTPVIDGQLGDGESFGFFVRRGRENVRVLFNAMRNIRGGNIGYIVSVHPDGTDKALRRQTAGMIVSAVVGFLIAGVLSWIIVSDRQRIASIARIDQLTGTYNRHALVETLIRDFDRTQRYGTPLSIIILDIDHFKYINEHAGHSEGDRVLKATAERVSGVIRKSDLLARWGGEEFIVVASNTIMEDVVTMAEKIRAAVASSPVTEETAITVSLGVAEYHAGESLESLLHRADTALYRAKSGGRNRTARES